VKLSSTLSRPLIRSSGSNLQGSAQFLEGPPALDSRLAVALSKVAALESLTMCHPGRWASAECEFESKLPASSSARHNCSSSNRSHWRTSDGL
jgi:hypothetical protein